MKDEMNMEKSLPAGNQEKIFDYSNGDCSLMFPGLKKQKDSKDNGLYIIPEDSPVYGGQPIL